MSKVGTLRPAFELIRNMDDALRDAVEVFKRESVAVLHAQKDAVYFKPFITCASKIKGVH